MKNQLEAAGIPSITFYSKDGETKISVRDVQNLPDGSEYYWQKNEEPKVRAVRNRKET